MVLVEKNKELAIRYVVATGFYKNRLSLVEKVVVKKGGDEVETWIHLPLYQTHQMEYESKCGHCRFT